MENKSLDGHRQQQSTAPDRRLGACFSERPAPSASTALICLCSGSSARGLLGTRPHWDDVDRQSGMRSDPRFCVAKERQKRQAHFGSPPVRGL